MTRVSLVEAYDNKDVIKQISDLKDAVGNLDTESVTGIVNDVNTLKTQMTAVNNTVQTQGQSIAQVRGNNVTQVTLSENLGSLTSALSKQDGTVLTSQSVNLKQVKTAVLVPGSSPNIFRLSLTLSDDTVIESNDIALQLETIEGQDIYMTAVELIEDSASHKLQVKITRSDGSVVLSNNVTYDYPSVADAVTEGLVKSSSAEGDVTVNADATMTVNGYATLSEDTEEALRLSSTANDRLNYMSNDITTLQGSVSQNTADIGRLSSEIDGLDLEGYVRYSENGNIVLGESQMTPTTVKVSDSYGSTEQTSEGLTVTEGTKKVFIDTDAITVTENGTDTVISYESLLPDASIQEQLTALRNDVDDNAGDISALEADTVQLRTQVNGKQDVLTAGAGVTISGNVISADVGLKLTVVTQLPATGESGVIYLISKGTPEDENAYDEWIWTNNRWEMIGNTSVDLSQYLKKESNGHYNLSSNEEINILNSDNSSAMILASRSGKGTIYLNDMNDSGLHLSQTPSSVKLEDYDDTFTHEGTLMASTLDLTTRITGTSSISYAHYGTFNIGSKLSSSDTYQEFSFDVSDANGIVRKKDLTDLATAESVTAVQNSVNAVSESVNTKVSTFQGTEYEGKILKVDATGNLVLADPPEPTAQTEGYVTFFDWDGGILYFYTTEEFLALTEMPPLPEDDGFMHYQEWNWSWEDAVEEVGITGWLNVGATCCAADGKGHVFTDFVSSVNFPRVTAGAVIDWGDGNIETVPEGSTGTALYHTYERTGCYHITYDGACAPPGTSILTVLQSPHYNYEALSGVVTVLPQGFNYTGALFYCNAAVTILPRSFNAHCQHAYISNSLAKYTGSIHCLNKNCPKIYVGDVGTIWFYLPTSCVKEIINTAHTPLNVLPDQYVIQWGDSSVLIQNTLKNIAPNILEAICVGPFTPLFYSKTKYLRGFYLQSRTTDSADNVSHVWKLEEGTSTYTYPRSMVYYIEADQSTVTNKYFVALDDVWMRRNFVQVPSNAVHVTLGDYKSTGSFYCFNCTEVESVPAVSVLGTLGTMCYIVVPDSLYDEWITAEGWSTIASNIVKQSEYKGYVNLPFKIPKSGVFDRFLT